MRDALSQEPIWLALLGINIACAVWSASCPDVRFCTIATCEKHISCFVFISPSGEKKKIITTQLYNTNKHSECHGCIDTGGFSSVCQGCVCVCVCVCVWVCGRKRDCGRNCQLMKNKHEAARIFLCIRLGLILWEATYKQQSNVVLLSALWCCTVIHHKPPTETLFCATSLAVLPPSW